MSDETPRKPRTRRPRNTDEGDAATNAPPGGLGRVANLDKLGSNSPVGGLARAARAAKVAGQSEESPSAPPPATAKKAAPAKRPRSAPARTSNRAAKGASEPAAPRPRSARKPEVKDDIAETDPVGEPTLYAELPVDQSSNPDEQGEADEQTAGDEQTTADERDEWPDWQPPNLAELQAARATAAPDDEGTSRLRSAPAAGGGRWVIATAVATAAAIGLLLALLFNAASPGSSSDSALGTVPASALTAARSYSVDLAGYNYRHLDQDFGVVLDHSTAPFKESFTRSSDALRSTLLKYHATATAKVVAAGVVSASVTQVVVLVFLDQTVTNTNQKGATTDRSQIEITLVPSGSSWLINGVILL